MSTTSRAWRSRSRRRASSTSRAVPRAHRRGPAWSARQTGLDTPGRGRAAARGRTAAASSTRRLLTSVTKPLRRRARDAAAYHRRARRGRDADVRTRASRSSCRRGRSSPTWSRPGSPTRCGAAGCAAHRWTAELTDELRLAAAAARRPAGRAGQLRDQRAAAGRAGGGPAGQRRHLPGLHVPRDGGSVAAAGFPGAVRRCRPGDLDPRPGQRARGWSTTRSPWWSRSTRWATRATTTALRAACAGVPLVADSAAALGALAQGLPVGTQADAHAYSMSFAKTVSAGGSGGAVVLPADGDAWTPRRTGCAPR